MTVDDEELKSLRDRCEKAVQGYVVGVLQIDSSTVLYLLDEIVHLQERLVELQLGRASKKVTSYETLEQMEMENERFRAEAKQFDQKAMALQSDAHKYQHDYESLTESYESLYRRNEQFLLAVQDVLTALDFYALKANYCRPHQYDPLSPYNKPPVAHDSGKRARAAIESAHRIVKK